MTTFAYSTADTALHQVVEVHVHVRPVWPACAPTCQQSSLMQPWPMQHAAGITPSLARAAQAALLNQYASNLVHAEQQLMNHVGMPVRNELPYYEPPKTLPYYEPISDSSFSAQPVYEPELSDIQLPEASFTHVHPTFRPPPGLEQELPPKTPQQEQPPAPAQPPLQLQQSSVRSKKNKKVVPDITGAVTTLMLKNVANRYTIEEVVAELQRSCAITGVEDYDFLYLPTDFNSKRNKGYGFINFTSTEKAESFRQEVLMASAGGREQILSTYRTQKILEVCNAKQQGRDENIIAYLNSQSSSGVSNPWFRPVLLLSGERTDFTLGTGLRLTLSRLHDGIYTFTRAGDGAAISDSEEVVYAPDTEVSSAEGYDEAVTADVDEFLRGLR